MIFANAGVPMIALHLPAMLALLVPIIAIEYLYGRYTLGIANSRVLSGVASANLASTLIGIPTTWFLMVVLNIATTGGESKGLDTLPEKLASVVLQSAWLVPYETDLDWMIPAATLTLLVPYFFASVFIERLILCRVWKGAPEDGIPTFVWRANGLTYTMLALGTGVMLAQALI
ncbi:hypothetical protein [Crateriforma spongiae]|uniref:hypothetical protein n=1 Tax=Crateriforma spongiae TaxID=2724528 RepID=UPI0014461B04|nr:hypothetical protein [Crateriforma spongiae]